jgi:hypothetical protein
LLVNFLVGAAVVSSFGGSAFGAKGKRSNVQSAQKKSKTEILPNSPIQNVEKTQVEKTQVEPVTEALQEIAKRLDEKKLGVDAIQSMIDDAKTKGIYDVLIGQSVMERRLEVGEGKIKEGVIKLLRGRLFLLKLSSENRAKVSKLVAEKLEELKECVGDAKLKDRLNGIFRVGFANEIEEDLLLLIVEKTKRKLKQQRDEDDKKRLEDQLKQQEAKKVKRQELLTSQIADANKKIETEPLEILEKAFGDLSQLGITDVSLLTDKDKKELKVKIKQRYYGELKKQTQGKLEELQKQRDELKLSEEIKALEEEKKKFEEESQNLNQNEEKKAKLKELIEQIDVEIAEYNEMDKGIDGELKSYDEINQIIDTELQNCDEVIKAIQDKQAFKKGKSFWKNLQIKKQISPYDLSAARGKIGKLQEEKKLIEDEIKNIDDKIKASEAKSGVNDDKNSPTIDELKNQRSRLETKHREVEEKIKTHEEVLDTALNADEEEDEDEEYQKQLKGEESQKIGDLFHEPKSAPVTLSSNNNSDTLTHDNEIVMLPKQLDAINSLRQERVAVAKSLLEDVAHSATSVISSNSFGSSMIMSTNIEPISSSSIAITTPLTGSDVTEAVRSLQDNVESRIEKLSTPTDPYEELIGQSRVGVGPSRGGSSSLKDVNVEQENRSHNNVSGSKSDGVVKHNDEKDNSDSTFDKDSKTGNSIPRKKGVSSGSEEELAPLPKTGLWVKASGGKTRQEKDLGIGAYNSQNLTLTAGMDLTFAENIVIGAAIGNNKIETLRDGVENKELMRANMFSIYSMARLKDRLTLSGNIGNTWFKDANGNDLGTSTLNTLVSLKYGAHIGHGIILAPKVSVEFSKTKSNVKIFDNDKTLYGTFSVGLSKKIPFGDGGLFVTPEVHGAVSVLMNEKQRKVDQTDLGIMNGTDKKLKHNFGGSLKFEGRDKLELDIGYEYNGAKKYSAHQGYLQVKLKF